MSPKTAQPDITMHAVRSAKGGQVAARSGDDRNVLITLKSRHNRDRGVCSLSLGLRYHGCGPAMHHHDTGTACRLPGGSCPSPRLMGSYLLKLSLCRMPVAAVPLMVLLHMMAAYLCCRTLLASPQGPDTPKQKAPWRIMGASHFPWPRSSAGASTSPCSRDS